MDFRSLLITQFDSTRPQGIASVVHVLRQPGPMVLDVLDGDFVLGSWPLSVARALETGSPTGAATRTLDLAELVEGRTVEECKDRGGDPDAPWVLVEGGMLQIGSSPPRLRSRTAGYAARLRMHDAPGQVLWSTAGLHEGDAFSVMPLRPGWYRLADSHLGYATTVRVLYPDPREKPRELPPVTRRVGEAGEIILACGQGLVLIASHGSHFLLALERADDGPAELVNWKAEQRRAVLDQRTATR